MSRSKTYETYKEPGSYKVRLEGARFLGFDTGHPGLLIDYRIVGINQAGYSIGAALIASMASLNRRVYSQYVPLDVGNEKQAEEILRALFAAVNPRGFVVDEERPVTSMLNNLNLLYATRVTMRVLDGRKSNGHRFARILWGDRDPVEVACEAAAARLGVEPAVIKETFGQYGIRV